MLKDKNVLFFVIMYNAASHNNQQKNENFHNHKSEVRKIIKE